MLNQVEWRNLMSSINLSNQFHPEVTILPNDFIDHYMPSANGTFVKVYLYLLRFNGANEELSISQIAEKLDETEKDILRALRYWEEKHLLSLSKESSGDITGITILTPVSRPKVQNTEPVSGEDTKEELRPKYSDAQIAQLKEREEVQFLFNAVERYLGHLLRTNDVQLVLYLYEGLGFSSELILHLYDYCVSMDKKNTSYIESVALAWAKEGIDTVDKAENASMLYNAGYQAVNKAFGLNHRVLGDSEKEFLLCWLNRYQMDTSLITEACNRTLLALSKPDFKYADKILKSWHEHGVKTLSDIEPLDAEHAKRSSIAASREPKKTGSIRPASVNKFNAFPQRQYTKEDIVNLERQLLKKGK